MLIRKYIVNNMNEAITRIRYELGKDAIIINQRKIRKPGIIGFFSKKAIEVTAASENTKKSENPTKESIDTIKNLIKSKSYTNTYESSKKIQSPQEIKDDIADDIKEMKQMMNTIISKPYRKSDNKSELEIKLESYDFNKKIIDEIMTEIKTMPDDLDDMEKIKLAMKKMILKPESKMQGTVVFVGPTGVGKTTTIAKLAGKMSLVEKKKVGLITIDTYRIGAVEQLKTYAEIMNIPFKVVLTLKEMEKAIADLNGCDVILIDTTGRSCKNIAQISELRAFVEKTGSKYINLVISCTTKDRDIDAIVKSYSGLNYNNVIITKLDETSAYGSILNIINVAKKPISYFTTGQNVPDDIKSFTDKEIVDIILGERNV